MSQQKNKAGNTQSMIETEKAFLYERQNIFKRREKPVVFLGLHSECIVAGFFAAVAPCTQ